MSTIDWTRLPSLTALRAFDAAAQAQSYSAAARALNVTHAAVAQQVKALEAHLGLTLVQSSPRGIVLTPDGQDLAARLQTGFAAIAEGIGALQDREASRPVRVTTTAFFADSVIFRHISGFWRDHPGIELSFTPTDAALDLVGEGFDLGVRAGSGNWPDLNVAHLFDSPTIACAAPGLVDDPTTDWTRVPWLVPKDSHWERDALVRSGIDPETVEMLDVGNPALELRAAEQGAGLLVESQADIEAHLRSGRLKRAPIALTHVSSYFLVTPPWRPRPSVQTFKTWLLAIGKTIGTQRPGGEGPAPAPGTAAPGG